MINSKTIRVEPSAYNLIESMRSIGYSFETAISDIIDNSISANAKNIRIFLNVYNNENYVQIFDDGSGMTKEELVNAMRLGSKNPNEERSQNDLGRFGLGLKSSSFSQCRTLTVISKKNRSINGLRWDLDYIAKTDLFEVIELSDLEISKIANNEILLDINCGTLVMWEKFDKIVESSNDISAELSRLMNHSIDHISLIYHRILDNGVSISVNENLIEPKDPFLKSHPGTQVLQKQEVFIDNTVIKLQPFILPHFSNLSANDKRLSGKIIDQYKDQGFYLYRNNRLILWGNYLGLNKRTELSKNLRILVDIPNSLDYLWDIDIKKSQARVPSKIKKNLLSALTNGEGVSKEVNLYKGKKEQSNFIKIWDLYTERDGNFRLQINENHPVIVALKDQLTPSQQELFNIVIKNIAYETPIYSIYSKLGEGSQMIKANDIELFEEFKNTSEKLKGISGINYLDYLKNYLISNSNNINDLIIEYIHLEMEKNNV